MTGLHLPDREFDAYIFDCDGTLVDSMPLHFHTWNLTLQEFGIPYTFGWQKFIAQGGKCLIKTIEEINELCGTSIPPEEFVHQQGIHYESIIDTMTPVEKVVEFARQKHAQGKPTAVASSGTRYHVELSLKTIGAFDLFDVICCREDVENLKPAPDLFLLAAKRLGIKPENCVVFEDSPLGIQAAKAASMDFVLVPSRESLD